MLNLQVPSYLQNIPLSLSLLISFFLLCVGTHYPLPKLYTHTLSYFLTLPPSLSLYYAIPIFAYLHTDTHSLTLSFDLLSLSFFHPSALSLSLSFFIACLFQPGRFPFFKLPLSVHFLCLNLSLKFCPNKSDVFLILKPTEKVENKEEESKNNNN